MNTRLRVLTLLFMLFALVLIGRLFYWQIIKGEELSLQARGQRKDGFTTSAPRGDILASDGTWLTATGQAWLVFAELKKLEDKPSLIADKLVQSWSDEEIGKDELLKEIDRIKSLLSREELSWVILKNKISPETKGTIEALGIKGIGFEKQETRVYPEGSSAAHLIGFVGKDKDGQDIGYGGLEGYYDFTLTGKPGYRSRETDARGSPIHIGNSKEVPAIKGVNLLTNIDKTLQLIMDAKLKEGVEKYGAISGSAVVLDPKNGSVLGMSAYPTYEPANYSKYTNEHFRNPVISTPFEPGSIFKVLIMAAGLDAGVVSPDTVCDICDGPLKIDKYTIGTWNKEYHPNSTMTQVIVNSDNVGMAYVGRKIGADLLYDYLYNFGFGRNTGVDLQGEATGSLRKKGSWNIVDLATASFGQGITATPIQLVKAVAAIANKGVEVHPHVVNKLVDGKWEMDIVAQKGERVISEKAASQITSMMAEAASGGESKWTHQKGYRVAGKTGTAQIPIAGYYDAEKTIASFIGFAPHDNPRFVMLVTLVEPKSSQWASETAAPLWYNIASDYFTHFGIRPEN
jgi:cell division protein FtsI/penicillin-binding protein 2